MIIELSDFPSVDYDSKKDKTEKNKKPDKQKLGFGTPISELSSDVVKRLK